MGATTFWPRLDARPDGSRVAAEVGLALLATLLLVLRVVSLAQRDTILVNVRIQLGVLAVIAVVLAAGAAVAAPRSERWTAWFLGGALLLELLLGLLGVRVPLIVAPPLLAALALVLVPILRREGQPGVDYSRGHTVVAVVSVTLMVPIGFFTLLLAALVPAYAVLVGLSVFGGLAVLTHVLADRRTWWVAAGPVLAITFLIGGLWVGDYFLGWTA